MHGQADLKAIPSGSQVMIPAETFENLLYIWEFFNNFCDFFQIPNFTISELQASLSMTHGPDEIHKSFIPEIESSQEHPHGETLTGFTWT
mmetsp:Transcript_28092/g.42497  ORF Transcript_28092/g.42497 Transcript_28092/m.42497 type:complete len:90 (+) Transcript_28092:1298-1567(+)